MNFRPMNLLKMLAAMMDLARAEQAQAKPLLQNQWHCPSGGGRVRHSNRLHLSRRTKAKHQRKARR